MSHSRPGGTPAQATFVALELPTSACARGLCCMQQDCGRSSAAVLTSAAASSRRPQLFASMCPGVLSAGTLVVCLAWTASTRTPQATFRWHCSVTTRLRLGRLVYISVAGFSWTIPSSLIPPCSRRKGFPLSRSLSILSFPFLESSIPFLRVALSSSFGLASTASTAACTDLDVSLAVWQTVVCRLRICGSPDCSAKVLATVAEPRTLRLPSATTRLSWHWLLLGMVVAAPSVA